MAVSVIDVPEAPPAELRFKRRIRPLAALRELWRARELIRTLAERDLRGRYKQAILGLAWTVVTPIRGGRRRTHEAGSTSTLSGL
jgi:ABC-2 type transport system permease protein/lipopolysaccharide transport system permease protein